MNWRTGSVPGQRQSLPRLSGQRESPAGLRPAGLSAVREGGVEPPRPCGHWNLNPARLPIPPPAHWVCLPAPFPSFRARRLPTPRTLARRPGWVHIPFPGAGAPTSASTDGLRPSRPASPEARPRRPPMPPELPPMSSGTPPPGSPRPPRMPPLRINLCLFTYQPRTGPARLPRSRTGRTLGCGTLVYGRLYDPGQTYTATYKECRQPSTGPTGGTSRFTGAWIRSVSSTR